MEGEVTLRGRRKHVRLTEDARKGLEQPRLPFGACEADVCEDVPPLPALLERLRHRRAPLELVDVVVFQELLGRRRPVAPAGARLLQSLLDELHSRPEFGAFLVSACATPE